MATRTINEQKILDEAVDLALENTQGMNANYIPELKGIDSSYTGISLLYTNGKSYQSGNINELSFTLQSAAKLVLLIGLLEEMGPDKVFSWVGVESSGVDFASLARLDQFGPMPCNAMVNPGAICLCSHIPGNVDEKFEWILKWAEKLFGVRPHLDPSVFSSERRTGDRNRSIAYLMKSTGAIKGEVNKILETYFYLCSLELKISQAVHLPMVLANHGKTVDGTKIISEATCRQALAVMAIAGFYNESGEFLLKTGIIGKSSVSGFILATSPNKAGIATFSPLLNKLGNSIRGLIMMEYVSEKLGLQVF